MGEEIISGEKIDLIRMSPRFVTQNYVDWMNDRDVMKFTESRWNRAPYTLDSVVSYVRKQIADPDVFMCAIVTKEGRHIGNIKLEINRNHKRASLGIIIGDKAYWGRGIGTEAIKILSEYSQKNFDIHKIFAGCYGTNNRSRKVFLNAGYKEDCVMKEHSFVEGMGFVDEIRYSLISNREK